MAEEKTQSEIWREKGITYSFLLKQGTEEWLRKRMGIVTASRINDLITPTGKIAKNEKVRSYAKELAGQRILKQLEDTYQSYDMMLGHLKEEDARRYYSKNFELVEKCGLITREFDGFKIGASPDGIILCEGGIEIKSRKAKFQIQTIIDDEVPPEFMNQIQGFLLVSDRQWCDFVSYSEGLPLFVKRVLPDQERQDLIVQAVGELEEMIQEYVDKYEDKAKNLIQTVWVDYSIEDEIQ